MRIIIFTSSTNRSGGTRQAMYQARGLIERGHDVSLCVPEASSLWELSPEAWWYPLCGKPRSWRAQIESLLPKSSVPQGRAIVHAFHNKAVKLAAWWGLFWLRRGVACVAHRGVLFAPNNPLPYFSPAMRAFAVNSEACGRAISRYTPARKIWLIRNAVPDERVTPVIAKDVAAQQLGLKAGNVCFVYVGGNMPSKGAEALLRAFAEADLPTVRLIMIGTDPVRWNPLTVELGLGERLVHLGHVEHVADYLQCADAFVFPTSTDSSPNTLLEAVRMGLPVIAGNVGGVPEIFANNGLLVPPGDHAALVKALECMATQHEQRCEWGAASRIIGERYSVAARCAALEDLYAKVLGEGV